MRELILCLIGSIRQRCRKFFAKEVFTSELFLYQKISKIFSPHKRASKPNVIVILADDLGFNDMPWNNPDIIAPNLHKLAKSGTIITDMYVQPVCTPSRSALMTSRKKDEID